MSDKNSADPQDKTLKVTPLTQYHKEMGARIVPFAGYEMPVSFEGGIAEHNHVRAPRMAGLFDVSHMGQITLSGANAAQEFEKLIPSNVVSLKAGKSKYSVLLNKDGGIIDDLILSKNFDGSLLLVVNGSRKYIVLDHLKNNLSDAVTITHHEDKALMALQGSAAVSVLSSFNPNIASLKFMEFNHFAIEGASVTISRTGYTGEDGFEISCLNMSAVMLYKLLLSDKRVKAIGLGARDTLRLEAGLSLYGQDLNTDISPIEAGLSWIISKQRTEERSYIASNIIAAQKEQGTQQIRVGLKPSGRAPMRSGTELFDKNHNKIGFISSGGFSPSLNHPISMGYIHPDFKEDNTEVLALLRGKYVPVTVTKLPFVPHKYIR